MKNTFKELTKEQQEFVRAVAEEAAGHALTDEGVQFWMDLQADK